MRKCEQHCKACKFTSARKWIRPWKLLLFFKFGRREEKRKSGGYSANMPKRILFRYNATRAPKSPDRFGVSGKFHWRCNSPRLMFVTVPTAMLWPEHVFSKHLMGFEQRENYQVFGNPSVKSIVMHAINRCSVFKFNKSSSFHLDVCLRE